MKLITIKKEAILVQLKRISKLTLNTGSLNYLKNLCEKCHKCNLIKHIKRKLIIPNIKPIPARQMEVVELDIQGSYIKSKNPDLSLLKQYHNKQLK